jgi:hypothetical protein
MRGMHGHAGGLLKRAGGTRPSRDFTARVAVGSLTGPPQWQLFVGVVAVAIFGIPVRLNNPASSVLHGLHGHVSGLL